MQWLSTSHKGRLLFLKVINSFRVWIALACPIATVLIFHFANVFQFHLSFYSSCRRYWRLYCLLCNGRIFALCCTMDQTRHQSPSLWALSFVSNSGNIHLEQAKRGFRYLSKTSVLHLDYYPSAVPGSPVSEISCGAMLILIGLALQTPEVLLMAVF